MSLVIPQLHPAALSLLFDFEGKPRLKARLCEGGRYEVAYGVTYYLDGSPVGPTDTISPDDVMPLTLNALAVEGAPVWRAVTRELTPEQAGALAVFAFNVGGSAAAGSTVVRMVNAGRWEDAAAAFGSWTGATSSGPTPTEINAGMAPAHPPWDRNTGRWLSPDGKPCRYFRRFRGLLRRHHAEGCLFLGYDHKEAVKNDAIELTAEARFNETKNQWEDKIIRQTEFASVLSVARKYPLTTPTIAQEPDPPKAAPTTPVKAEPLPEMLPESPLPKVEKPVTTPAKPPAVPQAQLPNDFDPNAGVKSMVFSRRFWGWMLIIVGRFSFFTDGSANLMASSAGAVGGVANMVASDPLLLDAYTGFAVMLSGEALRWWGEKQAKKALV